MSAKEIIFSFEELDNDNHLSVHDLALLNKAREASQYAYAPYSKFLVGAAAKLSNGTIVTGANQENASFPAGICSERVLLSVVASQFPNVGIETIAISYDNKNGNSDRPVSPCGICRQSLAEFEKRFNQPIKIILAGKTGKILIIQSASDLLPLSFSNNDLL